MTRWLWSDADGIVTDLSEWGAGTYVVVGGTGGVLAPEYDLTSEDFAGVDGATMQHIGARPAEPVLGLDLVASDPVELRQRVRRLAHTFRPRRGIGRLTAVDDDGSTRTLPCYYRKGLERGTVHATRYRTTLEFWSPSPWWRGTPLAHEWSLAAPSTFFPILPLQLSPSTIAGEVTFDLSGTDAPTHPRWTITGPGSQLTLENRFDRLDPDTGLAVQVVRSLVLSSAIGDGRTVTIDTRPGFQSIVRDDGLSLFGSLTSDPALWPLQDGVNVVRAVLANAGDASQISFTADRLYSGAL